MIALPEGDEGPSALGVTKAKLELHNLLFKKEAPQLK
jgi:hypothetical protein